MEEGESHLEDGHEHSCNPFLRTWILESESRSKEGSGSRGSPGRLMGQGRGHEGAGAECSKQGPKIQPICRVSCIIRYLYLFCVIQVCIFPRPRKIGA